MLMPCRQGGKLAPDCQAPDVRTASARARASRVAATSWTRTMAAPWDAATTAAATLPRSLSGAGFPVALPMNDLRDALLRNPGGASALERRDQLPFHLGVQIRVDRARLHLLGRASHVHQAKRRDACGAEQRRIAHPS